MDGGVQSSLKLRRHRFSRSRKGTPEAQWMDTPKRLEEENAQRMAEYDSLVNESYKRWSPRSTSSQDPFLLEHRHLKMNQTLPLSAKKLELSDMDDEDLEDLYDTLQKRVHSLTRFINEFQKQPLCPRIEVFTDSILEDTYHSTSMITPLWFRALFTDGPRTFDLVPTFPTELLGTSQEYKDLSIANFQITMSFKDKIRGVNGGLFVTEKLNLPDETEIANDDLNTTQNSLCHFSHNRSTNKLSKFCEENGAYKRKYWALSGRKRSPSRLSAGGLRIEEVKCDNDWLTNFCYSVQPILPIYKRRVLMTGRHCKLTEDGSSLRTGKIFRILFLLGEDDKIKGIYRRQMTSEPYFLTWRIILPQCEKNEKYKCI